MITKILKASLGVVAATMFASTASAALVNGGFEDAPFVGAEAGVPIAGWSDYGANFRVQCSPPGSACSDPIGGPGAFEGTVALKNFGNSGVFQDFAAAEGQEWAGSVQAMNPNNADQMVGGQIALAAIIWLDGGGGVISSLATNVLDSTFATGIWNLLTVTDTAPAGTATARFQVFTEDTGGGGGAPRFDDAQFAMTTVIPVPGAIFLMGPALLGLVGLSRKKAA